MDDPIAPTRNNATDCNIEINKCMVRAHEVLLLCLPKHGTSGPPLLSYSHICWGISSGNMLHTYVTQQQQMLHSYITQLTAIGLVVKNRMTEVPLVAV